MRYCTADQIKESIKDLDFWQCCRNYVHSVEDVLKALQVFDGKEPTMDKAWLTMHNLQAHVKSLKDPPFYLHLEVADALEESFEARWDMAFTNLHYVGALLNPYMKDYARLKEDGTTIRALYRIIRKLEGIVGVRFDDILEELT